MEATLPLEDGATVASVPVASAGSGEINDGEEIEETCDPDELLNPTNDEKPDDVKRLLQKGHSVHDTAGDGGTALRDAAWQGHVHVIIKLLRDGAKVDAPNDRGQTALFMAAEFGRLTVVRVLIKHGATVDAADESGVTPLLIAATRNQFDTVRELIYYGADVRVKRNDGGWGALHYAAANGDSAMVATLLSKGANPASKTEEGKSVLLIAVQFRQKEIVRDLLLATVLDKDTCSQTLIEVFVAATIGDMNFFDRLVTDGRLPPSYAAGLDRMAAMRTWMKGDTSVVKKLVSTDSSPGRETPLTLAGHADHKKIFELLIKSGAPINVRSHDTGETPLISAARWDFVAGVQLLLSNGGALRYDDVPEANGCPLIPGTLETMKSLCVATIEFESICSRFVKRLQAVCSQLQALDPANVQDGVLVTFTSVLFRFCRLQMEIEKWKTPLVRFIGSRAVVNKIYDFHEELDHFADLLGLAVSWAGVNSTAWKAKWSKDQSLLSTDFETKLANDETIRRGWPTVNGKHGAAILLQSELMAHAREGNVERQKTVQKVRDRYLELCGIESPVLPPWFISREDVDMHSWKVVWSGSGTTHYAGEWRKTSVRIETFGYSVDNIASRLFVLNHPNVIKLFGACNTEFRGFFVYEQMRDSKQLLEILQDDKSYRSGAMWNCLHQAGLGLRYIHNQGLAHGYLRPENILVDSNLVTKLSGLHDDPYCYKDMRGITNWKANELYDDGALPSAASDIYAFGVCIWEAVARELPWKGIGYLNVKQAVRKGKLPDRPSLMTDDEWDLITKMCKHDPAERVDIEFVVNRLEKFVFDNDQRAKNFDNQRSNKTDKNQSVEEHFFSELNDSTISETLKRMRSKCERLPEEDQWVVTSVLPALEFVYELLQQQHKTANDMETMQFCSALSRFQRHLRTTLSENSTRRCARSRKIAETNNVVYAELDRLLDLLEVSDEDPIRQWRHISESSQQGEIDGTSSTSTDQIESSGGDVSVVYFDTPSTNHELWTSAGLKAIKATPPWTLPLKDVLFKESDHIGSGAFGEVFKGSWLGTPVVIKFMGYEEDEDTIPTDLLLHEARVWHHLNHPHVLRLYGASHRDKRYFVCEFASGGDLLDFLKKPGNEKLKWQKLYEAALGLQYLHGQNVTHNDLKCDNIMVGMDGNAKLIDFGLSCLLNEAEIKIETKKMGAVNWRSPEYLAGGRPSFASDVYSFAMCIIEVISGDIPWGRNLHPAGVKFQVRKGNTPNLPDSMNEKQCNLIKLMTKKEPSDRVRMGFVVDKLSEITREEGSGGAAP